MLADSLKLISQAEAQAEQIILTARQQAGQIEKETYQEIEKINAETETAIAQAVAKLPQPGKLAEAKVVLNVPDSKMTEAVNLITKALLENEK